MSNNKTNSNKLKKEKNNISLLINALEIQKSFLLDYIQKFATSKDDIDTKFSEEILSALEDSQKALNICSQDTQKLNELLNNILNINLTNLEIKEAILQNYIETQNFLLKSYSKCTLSFNNPLIVDANNTLNNNSDNKFDTSLNINTSNNKLDDNLNITASNSKIDKNLNITTSNGKLDNNLNISTSDNDNLNNEINIQNNIDISKYKENTLIISEQKGNVILPYTLKKLIQTLSDNKNKYSDIDEIIEKDYTLSIKQFKNPSIARFKEAFKLIRNKQQGSIKEAFDLGMELLFNYNLHPAIITACKNIDELDIYLDYLENGETDKFNIFKITFEIAPVVIKNK